MALYLVVHTPKSDEVPLAATRLQEMAIDHGTEDSSPRWIRAWSPDLHDERIFSMWDAANADEILHVIARYSFLDHMDAHPVQVQEWGPSEVLAAVVD
ncbi:MAG: hypothetical protein ABIY38_08600 [Rhodococcus sp. (in: high G+C Gram-positive bacteria)]